MNIQLGICQWSIPAKDAKKQLALAAQVDLAGVEPDLGSYEQDFPLSHKDMQAQYKTWREQFGLVYPALAVNALCNYGMSQSASHAVANLAIAKAVETAVALDIPIVQLPSFVKGDIISEEDFQNTLVCLRHACDCAAGTDLIIGSENALPAEK
ncbi:MAG: hypothetical protein E4H27_05100 [Anaerolineales bacterium]|nr:MAG: hypothetical protein E4H27_05100 [Anaerolineales bacterium]